MPCSIERSNCSENSDIGPTVVDFVTAIWPMWLRNHRIVRRYITSRPSVIECIERVNAFGYTN